ncbi:MAG: hypothetical protein QM776_14245 [Rhodocyclaceae bacterium]
MPLPHDSLRGFARRALCVALAASLAIHPVAAQLPELGDASQSVLSAAKERSIGETAMREIRQYEPSYIDDAEVEYYLNRVG